MRVALLLVAALLASACGDNTKATPDDAGVIPDTITPTPDAPSQAAGPCIDQPTDVPRPPSLATALPCDMLPPGFSSP